MEGSSFKDKMAEARGELDKTAISSQNLKRDFGAIQKGAAIVGGAVLAGIGASVKVASDFEQSMAKVQAISGSTAAEFKLQEAAAREMGAATIFSGSEAAEGLGYLAMAGFTVEEQIGSLPAVLNAAIAGNMSLGDSANIVTNIMSAFGLTAEDSGKAVDVLAKAANSANTDIPLMGEAFKMVAPVANALGWSIEETAAAIGELGNVGISGSQAGTVLRASLLALANPTGQTEKAMKKLKLEVLDAEGNMKPLPELMGHVASKMKGMTDTQKTQTAAQLVGTQAAAGFIALLEVGEEGLQDFTTELENSEGAAQKMADIQSDTLVGSFKEFESAMEEVGIQLGNEFIPIFREVVAVAIGIIEKFGEIDSKSVATIATFIGITAAVAGTLATIGKLSLALSAFALTPVGAAIIGLSLLGGLIVTASMNFSDFEEVNLEVAETMIETNDALETNIGQFKELQKKSKLSTEELGRFLDIQDELAKAVDDSEIERLTKEQEELRKKSGLSNEELGKMIGLNNDLIEAVPESTGHITEQGNRVVGTTDALRDYNAELAEGTMRELERQKIIAEGNERELKEEIVKLQAEYNEGLKLEEQYREEFLDFDQKAAEARLDEIEHMFATEELTYEKMNQLNSEQVQLEGIMENYQKQYVKQMEINDENKETLDLLESELGLADDISEIMIQQLLKQVGINSERGKGIEAVDKEIKELQKAKAELDKNTDQAAKNTQEYKDAVTEIDNQITGLEIVKGQVIDLYGEHAQVKSMLIDELLENEKITAEKGKGIEAVEKEIGKQKEKKKKLEDNTKASEKNTKEYKESIAKIDGQISSLNKVRGRITDILGYAGDLNRELGRGISKNVTIQTSGRTDMLGPQRIAHAGSHRADKAPKMHAGGQVAKVMDDLQRTPMHNEIDMRLLRNEMVLTEAQQASLFSQLNGGTKEQGGNSFDNSEVIALLGAIAQGVQEGRDVQIVMNEREVARAVEPHVTNQQNRKNNPNRGGRRR